MRYYYFNPFSKQYYFPENFIKSPLFLSFYQSYTVKGKILWEVWLRFSFLRYLFSTTKAAEILPINQLKQYLPINSILAFNRGTLGIEQKTTVLGSSAESKEVFFIKYAESSIARKNISNEGKVLRQLAHLEFVPQLQLIVDHEDYSFIQTSVLRGRRLSSENVDKQLIAVLLELSKQQVAVDKSFSSSVNSCFAHGDFCPWNMMIDENRVKIFDWEMAGIYPTGYDLFTYVFQTSFLLSPDKSIKEILIDKKEFINSFFRTLKIKDWHPYFLAFGEIKLEFETKKKNLKLIESYQRLKQYAEKI